MKLTNLELQYIWGWIDRPLHGQQLKDRTIFVSLIRDHFNAAQSGREKILSKYTEKNEKGKPVFDERGLYKIAEDKQEEAKKELALFHVIENDIKVDKKKKQCLKTIVKLIEEHVKVGIAEGDIVASVISKLENVK